MPSKTIIHLSAKLHAVDSISNLKPFKILKPVVNLIVIKVGDPKIALYLLLNEIPLQSVFMYISVWLLRSFKFINFCINVILQNCTIKACCGAVICGRLRRV